MLGLGRCSWVVVPLLVLLSTEDQPSVGTEVASAWGRHDPRVGQPEGRTAPRTAALRIEEGQRLTCRGIRGQNGDL